MQEFHSMSLAWSMGLFFVINLLWGAKVASDSIIQEVNGKTWDFQRLTLLSPLQMSFGKLFGGTIYNWYGAGITLFMFLLSANASGFTLQHFYLLLFMILSTILIHSLSMNLSLLGIRKNRNKEKINAGFYTLIAFGLSFLLLSYLFNVVDKKEFVLSWYSLELGTLNILLLSLIFYTAWSVYGLYRSMRFELHYRNGPFAWLSFLLSFSFVLSGFLSNMKMSGLYNQSLLALALTFSGYILICLYLIFSESKYIIDIKFLLENFLNQNWIKVMENSPLWLVTLILTGIIGIVLSILLLGFKFDNFPGLDLDTFTSTTGLFLYPFVILGFLLRDILIILSCNLAYKQRKGDVLAIIYLFLIYFLIPMIFIGIKAEAILYIFWPIPSKEANSMIGLVVILFELVPMFLLSRKLYIANASVLEK